MSLLRPHSPDVEVQKNHTSTYAVIPVTIDKALITAAALIAVTALTNLPITGNSVTSPLGLQITVVLTIGCQSATEGGTTCAKGCFSEAFEI